MEQNITSTQGGALPPTSAESAEHEKSVRLKIGLFGFFLFIVFVVGLFWMATTPELTVGLTLSFIAGLSMIFLPCTLPLAFVIVPLTMGKDPKKGLFMALSFTLGLTITLSLYGVFIAAAGKAFGLKSDAEVYAVLLGGLAAFIFGLSEVGLINFKLPSYSGKFPDFIQRRKDYMKTFLLGLLLGNAGVGCPNPAFYVLLGYIATTGDLFNGWFLGFVHGMGRSVPLIFLAILGTLGVNALSGVARHKEGIGKVMGWMLLIIGAYLLTFGIFGHDWFIASGTHGAWEQFVVNISGERFGETILQHEHPLVDIPDFIKYGNLFFLGLLAITILTSFIFRHPTRRTIVWLSITYIAIALVIGNSTGWTFTVPPPLGHSMAMPEGTGGAHDDEHGGAIYHEEGEVKSGPAVNLNITPVPFRTGQAQKLDFFVNEKPGNIPIPAENLEIEHEKLMHVIGVRSDLNEFFHIHPSPSQLLGQVGDAKQSQKLGGQASQAEEGHFTADYIFSNPGLYKIWSEIKSDGVNYSFDYPEISVEGEGEKYRKEIFFGISQIVGNYQVVLHKDELAKGINSALNFEIHDSLGREIEVEPYLDADMHLTLIKDDWKQFIHTHPAGDAGHDDEHGMLTPGLFLIASANGGDDHNDQMEASSVSAHGISFRVVFPEAGLYKVFAQFRPQGIDLPQDEALTASFWIKVEEKAPPVLSGWWINLTWSLAAIVVLSVLVKKYLKVKQ